MKIWPGKPYPLGATWDGLGVNFAIFSENAEEVELCLFDRSDDERESARLRLAEQTDRVWHGYLPEARPGQLNGYRVHGRYAPDEGHRFNASHPRVLQLIMDSLRYWVVEMHVDGFRFDLASALARELYEVDRLSAFFDIIHQDPVLSQVKLIAEPWDIGDGGYQVGNFPVLWTESNGRYRDVVRSFWKGEGNMVSELATRLSGSSDLYEGSGRRPYASINFVTCHDGYTLRDLVSYNDKHNEANLEDNRDGDDHNMSWNCGVEGETDDPEIQRLRRRQMRNFMATLLLSQGVAMIRGGDELSHTQQGNNNACCQDNELSWLDWSLDGDERGFLAFVRRLIALWRDNPGSSAASSFKDDRYEVAASRTSPGSSRGAAR